MITRVSPAPPGGQDHMRLALLDCIRAAAILGVLVYHVATLYDGTPLDALAAWCRRFGLLGVDVFFPLSGFLITGFLLRNTGPGAVQAFALRRIFRIVPLYLVAVSVYWVISLVLGREEELLGRIWVVYSFLTGWMIFFDGKEAVPFTITWSLSVEVFAYALVGVIAWLRRSALVPILAVLCIAPLALRWGLLAAGPADVYHFPLTRLDSLATGGMVAWALLRFPGTTGRSGLLAGLAILTVLTILASLTSAIAWEALKYSFITFGTCTLIVLFDWIETRGAPRLPGLRHVAAVGFYSYYTYLFHFFTIYAVVEVAKRVLPDGALPPFWITVALVLALTQLQAVISFKIFERPLARFGRRLEKPRAPASQPA